MGNLYDMYRKSVKIETNIWGSFIVTKHHPNLKVIGIGRSAVVLHIIGTDKVIKVFPKQFEHICKTESTIYNEIKEYKQFPAIYETGKRYIVMEYIKGKTLYQYVSEGEFISDQYFDEVDDVFECLKQQGLNPSDVHLRNIMIDEKGHLRIIDVARFKQKKECTMWKDIKAGYRFVYKRKYRPKKIPGFLLIILAALYKKKFLPQIYKN